MADAPRLAITKRFSLSEVAEGWEDCYLFYTPLTTRDLLNLKDLKTEGQSDDQAVDAAMRFAAEHIVGGQVKVFDDKDAAVVAKAEPAHFEQLPQPVQIALFQEMTGANLHPKDTKTVTETSSTGSAGNEPPTS